MVHNVVGLLILQYIAVWDECCNNGYCIPHNILTIYCDIYCDEWSNIAIYIVELDYIHNILQYVVDHPWSFYVSHYQLDYSRYYRRSYVFNPLNSCHHSIECLFSGSENDQSRHFGIQLSQGLSQINASIDLIPIAP